MAITGEARHELYLHFEESMGRRMASNLMELLPPEGWGDIATKQDVLQLASLTEERFRHQRELMQEGFARMDERFARMDERFEGMATKADLAATTADIAELRGELRSGLAELRAELYRAFCVQFGAILVAVGAMNAAFG